MDYRQQRSTTHPTVIRLIDRICEGNPLQKKSLTEFANRQDDTYWDIAETLCSRLQRNLLADGDAMSVAADSYNGVCRDLLFEEFRFRKTGQYPSDSAKSAFENVYSNQDVMRKYVVGLLLSHLFWPNHYKMLRYFQAEIAKHNATSALEIGAGHGLFVTETMRAFPNATVTVLDISEASLGVTREMLQAFEADESHVEFVLNDFLEYAPAGRKWDLIVMGEVLEHVNEPSRFLRQAHAILSPNGRVYMSTCANCPAVDHVYRFHNPEEIRVMLREAGFVIESDLALPARNVPEALWEKELVTINYSAMLRRAEAS